MSDINYARKWMKAAIAVTSLYYLGVIDLTEFKLAGMQVSHQWSDPKSFYWILLVWGLLALYKMFVYLRYEMLSGRLVSYIQTEEVDSALKLMATDSGMVNVHHVTYLRRPGLADAVKLLGYSTHEPVGSVNRSNVECTWEEKEDKLMPIIVRGLDRTTKDGEKMAEEIFNDKTLLTKRRYSFFRWRLFLKATILIPYGIDNILTTAIGTIIFVFLLPIRIWGLS